MAAKAEIDLHEHGARVVSVFGPFASRVLIEMPASAAAEMFPNGALAGSGRSNVIDAVERDLAEIAETDERLAESALAATASALAYELEHPYNSATAKSMCAGRLIEAMERLRELAPPRKEKDRVDEIAEHRAARRARAGIADSATQSRP